MVGEQRTNDDFVIIGKNFKKDGEYFQTKPLLLERCMEKADKE